MRIAFRVDASARIGTGHIRRSLALAHALAALGAQVVFVTRALGFDSAAIIGEAGFDCVVLPEPEPASFTPDPAIAHAHWAKVSSEQDAQETVSALRDLCPDWVVLDSYSFGAHWHDTVRKALGCRIAQIDDLADRRLGCDLLIDHNFARDHRAKYAAVLDRPVRLLGGPRYALLGPRYADAPRYEFSETVRSIGVFMGGADPDDATGQVIEAITACGFEGGVEIVTTSANPNLETLRARANSLPAVQLGIDLPDLADFFARHDLQIGAGGGATWERCCIGAPTLLVAIAANQLAVAPQLAEEGIVAFASHPTSTAIAEQLRLLLDSPGYRHELSQRSHALVDGRGAHRVALAMLAASLTVRRANASDAENLYRWRNDPANRMRSNDTRPFGWDDHLAWLERVLGDANRRLMIGEIGGMPVGVIRFDNLDQPWPEVSLHLVPGMSGLGLGPYLLAAGEAEVDLPRILATVLEDNAPSQALFRRAGYHQVSPTRWEKDLPDGERCA